MPGPLAIAGAFGHICNVVGFSLNIRDIVASLNPSTPLSIDDVRSVVRGEHAVFFKTVILADMETTYKLFYDVWIPSIPTEEDITSADLTSGGLLYNTSTELSRSITKLHRDLNTLAAVFKEYESDLWIDELTQGYYAFIEGYGLLLSMHSLHHFFEFTKFGKKSNRQNMLHLKQYVSDAKSILSFFYVESDSQKSGKAVTGKILDRRLRRIKALEIYNQEVPPSIRVYASKVKRTSDDYEPRSKTPSELVLIRGFKESKISYNDHYNAVFNRTQQVVLQSVEKCLAEVEKRAKEVLDARAQFLNTCAPIISLRLGYT
ncbi:hypothetical protein H0H92_003259 [Tricholoma furcatifolium]|nr:hypothetical protein H0H92_003259 [Tricholoma furcatifolium]